MPAGQSVHLESVGPCLLVNLTTMERHYITSSVGQASFLLTDPEPNRKFTIHCLPTTQIYDAGRHYFEHVVHSRHNLADPTIRASQAGSTLQHTCCIFSTPLHGKPAPSSIPGSHVPGMYFLRRMSSAEPILFCRRYSSTVGCT